MHDLIHPRNIVWPVYWINVFPINVTVNVLFLGVMCFFSQLFLYKQYFFYILNKVLQRDLRYLRRNMVLLKKVFTHFPFFVCKFSYLKRNICKKRCLHCTEIDPGPKSVIKSQRDVNTWRFKFASKSG